MTVAFLQQTRGRPAVRGLSFSSQGGAEETRIVSVRGEVDACNAKEFAITVCDLAARAPRLILDLTRLDFIAIEGCVALHSINLHVMRADATWVVEPSAAVVRLLQICDRERLIPAAGASMIADDTAERIKVPA